MEIRELVGESGMEKLEQKVLNTLNIDKFLV